MHLLLERPLFIDFWREEKGLDGVEHMWHPHRCHIEDTRAKGQACKSQPKPLRFEWLKVCSHMCEKHLGNGVGDKRVAILKEVGGFLFEELLTHV